ncbi:MAG: sulfatase-like hydrolase/transferase, partial [Verrucomicrobiaceae bacterium]
DVQKDHFDHLMAVYSAVVAHMDKAIGDLVAGLKKRGVFDNTLILFMSDNGGNAEAGPGGRSEGDPSKANSDWFCGESWASLQNTPFRRYKHYNHEGGIATPLIAHWPAGLNVESIGNRSGLFSRKAPGGPLCNQPAHLIDIMATCVDVGLATYPKEFNGKPIVPMEGTSLLNLFKGGSIERGPIFWEHEGNAAVRDGSMKLVRAGRNGPWELYDMKADRTEQHDLASAQPETATKLAAKWDAWAQRAQVIPYPKQPGKKKAPNP